MTRFSMAAVRGLYDGLHRFTGRENVRWVSIDLCGPYKKFVGEFFPNANIVADKFHVLRLLNGSLMKYRKEAEGGKNTRALRNLLLGGNMTCLTSCVLRSTNG